VPIFVIQVLAGSLRGIGDTKSPMIISGIQIFLHMTLNFLLVFPAREFGGITIPGAGMGLLGAVTALTVSAWVSAVIYVFWAGSTPLGEQWRIRLPKKQWLYRILRIAFPAATMAVLRVASFTTFTLVLASVPNASVAIAAMGVALGIEPIMFMPAFGLSVAAGALVGQSLGMKRPERAERLAWVAGHYGAGVTAVLALFIFLFAPGIAHLLVGNKPDISAEALLLIRYLCATEVLFSYAMVMMGALQGAGDTVRPMWISIIAMWGLRVPMSFLLALPAGFHVTSWLALPFGLGAGAAGAWFAMTFTQGIQGLMSLAAFKQGAWKLKEV
jgi:putative MATE family efflux protein